MPNASTGTLQASRIGPTPTRATALRACLEQSGGWIGVDAAAPGSLQNDHHTSSRERVPLHLSPDPSPTMVVAEDDLVATGRTMRLTGEVIRAESVAAFGSGGC